MRIKTLLVLGLGILCCGNAVAGDMGFLPHDENRPPLDEPNMVGDWMEFKNTFERVSWVLPPKNPKLHVNTSTQKLCLEAYGNACAKEFPVSTGAYDTPTPKGDTKVYFHQTLRVAGGETPYRMPYYMSIRDNGEYGFHSLPYLGNNRTQSVLWTEARSHIGVPVSHGCIRLLPEDIEKLYTFIPDGTPVSIQ